MHGCLIKSLCYIIVVIVSVIIYTKKLPANEILYFPVILVAIKNENGNDNQLFYPNNVLFATDISFHNLLHISHIRFDRSLGQAAALNS